MSINYEGSIKDYEDKINKKYSLKDYADEIDKKYSIQNATNRVLKIASIITENRMAVEEFRYRFSFSACNIYTYDFDYNDNKYSLSITFGPTMYVDNEYELEICIMIRDKDGYRECLGDPFGHIKQENLAKFIQDIIPLIKLREDELLEEKRLKEEKC